MHEVCMQSKDEKSQLCNWNFKEQNSSCPSFMMFQVVETRYISSW